MKTQSFCLRESQSQAIEDIARESVRREDIPEMSKSEVARRLIDSGLEEDPDVGELVSESTQVKLREQRYMADEGDLVNKRSGFETQVKRHFKTRFENGYRPEQLEEFAVNMRAKARAYWPEDIGDDYSERREEALAYVEALLEEAKEAADSSEYDPLDPSEVFSHYSGVEEGEERREQRQEVAELVEEANRLLSPSKTGSVADGTAAPRKVRDPDDVVAMLTERGYQERVAERAVEEAQGGGR